MSPQESFTVRFYPPTPWGPKTDVPLNGVGTLLVEPDFVTVTGRTRRTLRLARQASHRIRMVDIANVWTDGDTISFQAREVGGVKTFRFGVADPADAERLLALLPARKTEAFVTARTDQETFGRQIAHRGPRVPVMWLLIAANVAVFLLLVREGTPATPQARAQQLVQWGSNAGRLTLAGEWWRLVTSMFLHGSWMHILLNMFVLLQVGSLVERMFGSLRFAFLYLVAGITGSLASVLWNPYVNSVGASGAIFGTIGALLAFIRKPDSGVPGTVVTELRGSISTFLLFNIIAGLVYPHTDNAAHLGGLAGGYLMGWLLARPLHLPEREA